MVRERRRRALEEPMDVRPRVEADCPEFEVANPRHGTRYFVFLPEFPAREGALCNCTDFGRRGIGTCKHIEAVLLWLSEHPEETGSRRPGFDGRDLWDRIDRALARQRSAPKLSPSGLRAPGEELRN